MALQAFPLSPASAGSLIEITPKAKNSVAAPITAAMLARSHVPTVTYTGGAYGDDVSLATANSTDAYEPKTQAAKAALPGASPPNAVASEPDFVLSTDITAPRGYIGPRDPYSTPVPAAPVISSLAPNTAVAGTPSPLNVVITGTGFTQWTKIRTGGIETPYAYYVSPTKMNVLMDPARSVAGIVQIIAVDHSVASSPSNFTFT